MPSVYDSGKIIEERRENIREQIFGTWIVVCREFQCLIQKKETAKSCKEVKISLNV